MRAYAKGLIVLSAIFILPAFASAAEPTDKDNLDITMTVVESPQDSSAKITNRIVVPTEEYMQAREKNRRRDRSHRMDGDSDHEAMEVSQEKMQDQLQERHEMMQDQHQEIMQQQQDVQNETTGHTGGAPGMGM